MKIKGYNEALDEIENRTASKHINILKPTIQLWKV